MQDSISRGDSSALVYASKGVSYLLHPFFVPVYMMLALFATGLVPLYVSSAMKHYLFGLIGISTVCIPAMSIIILRLFRIIPDYSLSTRHDRMLPLLLVALCYGMCGWILKDVQMVFILRRCIFAAMGCVAFAFVVNFFWQISLHMTAMGGALGVVFILLYGGYVNLIWVFCIGIVLAGLLGSARLYLGRHTIGQVAAGFFGAFFIAVLAMLLFG